MKSRNFLKRARAVASRYIRELFSEFQSSAIWPVKVRILFLRVCGQKVHYTCLIPSKCHIRIGRIAIGPHVAMGVGVHIDGTGYLVVEERVHVGAYAQLLTGTHTIQPSVYRRDRRELVRGTTRICRGAWIGAGAIVLPGVTIAEGCVVAAGAVVIAATEPNGLYAGIPARRVKDLPIDANSQ